jgi:hypothetical protein
MSTNLKQYVNLRTLLDSLEVGALRFYLSGTGMSPRQKYRYLEDKLMPIIDDVWHQPQGSKKLAVELDCPPGYYECDGVCVPYRCPDPTGAAAMKKAKAKKQKR